MLSHVKYRNSNFSQIEKNLIISRPPKVKENGTEYSPLENIYYALFYSVLEYIHQFHMLSHVKYRNSIFNQREKKSKYYIGAPRLKESGSEYSLLEKIYNALFYSVLQYRHPLSMLPHVKYRNSNFK